MNNDAHSVCNIVAFRGSFDTSLLHTSPENTELDRVPGRDLAELLHKGLSRAGFELSPIASEEPFYCIECKMKEVAYTILSYIYDIDPKNPGWIVEIPLKVSWWGKLWGMQEPQQLIDIAQAIHESLSHDERVEKPLRWFRGNLPIVPFDSLKFSHHPKADPNFR